MKQQFCCSQIMKVRPVNDEYGLLFSYECDICKDGFSCDPAEQNGYDLIQGILNAN